MSRYPAITYPVLSNGHLLAGELLGGPSQPGRQGLRRGPVLEAPHTEAHGHQVQVQDGERGHGHEQRGQHDRGDRGLAEQSDRRTLAVPSQFSSIDSQYGDGLSAGIAALNELINGMDTDNVSKIRDGFKKLEGAMLTIAKAETALGSQAR